MLIILKHTHNGIFLQALIYKIFFLSELKVSELVYEVFSVIFIIEKRFKIHKKRYRKGSVLESSAVSEGDGQIDI